jgi:hypothetical protein
MPDCFPVEKNQRVYSIIINEVSGKYHKARLNKLWSRLFFVKQKKLNRNMFFYTNLVIIPLKNAL